MSKAGFSIEPIGYVRSKLTSLDDAPRQGDEGAPDAWLDILPQFKLALTGVSVGNDLMLLTWLHLADREVLQVHPRSDPARQLTGVFATRSPARPNPIGLHRVTVLEVAKLKLRVAPLEAINGTPLVDIKRVLEADLSGR